MRLSPRLAALSAISVGIITMTFVVSDSYSISNPLDFAGIMKQSSGYTTIATSGESSTTLEPDSAVMVLAINSPPSDLQKALDNYNQNMADISEELERDLADFDDVSISYIQTNFDGNRFGYGGGYGSGNTDSFIAYMSFPIKVDMTNYQNISQEITDLGLRIDDIRISKVPVKDTDAKKDTADTVEPVRVSVPYGTSIPECEIANECFLPAEVTIDAGTEVVWSNDDDAAHTVTSGTPEDGPDGMFDSSLFMAGDEFSHVFDSPGDYPYFCLVHPWMTGSITVREDGTGNDLGHTLEATINVRYETKPDTLENTLSAYTQTLDDLSALLEENGASGEIPRSTININPSHYDNWTFDTYQTYGRWTVKTTLDDLNTVHDILSKYGGVERLYMSHSKESIESVRAELTQIALDDARKNVLEIIGPMNLEIKGIKSIKINQDLGNERNPQFRYGGVFVSYDDWNNIKDGNVSVTVDVEFEVGR